MAKAPKSEKRAYKSTDKPSAAQSYEASSEDTVPDETAPDATPAEDPPTDDIPAGDPLELRFSDNVLFAMDEKQILVANRVTGAYRYWPRSDEERLGRYLDWQSLPGVVTQALGEDRDLTRLNEDAKMLAALLEIGVLDERTGDLSGARLRGPGDGWDAAMRFLHETRTTRQTIFAIPEEFNRALAEKAVFARQPSAFYERVHARVRPLSDPAGGRDAGALRFEDVLRKRRTARRFASTPLTEPQLSALLYYGWGSTDSVRNPLGDVFLRKTSPSGGSLHPIEVYPVIMNVEGLPRGLFHYSVRRHALEEISLEDPRQWIAEATGDQEWVAEAGVVFLCTAFLPRTAWKYNYSRVARAVMAEVGFTGQSALLAAAWLGVGGFVTIALRDQIWEEKLGLDPAREPVLSVIGAGRLEADIDDHARPRKESALGVETS